MASADAFTWLALGEWRAHPWRAVLAGLAIAIGVALGLAVHLVNQSALDEFARAIHSVNGEADLQVKGTSPAGFDETLYPKLARHPAVAHVSPVVELNVSIDGERLTLLGLDPLRAVAVTPSLLWRDLPFKEDAIYLSAAAMGGRKIGDRFGDFTIAGDLPGIGADRPVAAIDIASAQARFGMVGRLQSLDLKLAAGHAAGELRDALPADAVLVDQESEEQRGDSLSRAYRVNLDMLAMVALLTGGFLVYSAQSLSVTRRQTHFALLRVLGLRRRRLLAQICLEGAVLGCIGAALGLGLGTGLAYLVLGVLGGDLGGGYFNSGHVALSFQPIAAVALFVLGVAASLAGSLLPALAAAKAQPAVALKNVGGDEDPRKRPKVLPALCLLAAGGLMALAPPLWGLPLLGYGSIGVMLAGGVAAMPWVARLLLAPLRPMAPALDLAAKRLRGAPGQAAIALAGIVASTSLTIAMAVMVASFRQSVDDWLLAVLPADLYVRTETGDLDQQRLAAANGIARIQFRKTTPLRLAANRPAVALISRDPEGLPLISQRPAEGRKAWISEPMQLLYHLKEGDRLELPLGNFTIAGIWRDYGRQHGAIVVNSVDYQALTGDLSANEAAIDLQPGADPEAVMRELRGGLPDGALMAQPAVIRANGLKLFDRSFAVTYGLEAIAILVGLSGVAATLSAQVIARAKEFGMLRHIGVRKRQIVTMLAAEGALLGALGIAAGTGLGIAMSQVLIHVINPQSFHWTMRTRLPWELLAGFAVAMIVAAALTGLFAGRRALSVEAVRAVREDW
jgi:putative ABC transport system permease protein